MIPLTVIGGYLGAGKTTLINHLLRQEHGRRLAILVNDFGSINIDAQLIAAHDGETVTLTNGCVCCTISDSLGDALDEVIALPEPPEQIVVEASGVAHPEKIANYGRGWPGLRLDAVVVVADAESVQERARDKFVGDLVQRQLAAADAVILNKIDRVETDRHRALLNWIGETSRNRPVVCATYGQTPIDFLLEPRSQNEAIANAGAPPPEDDTDHATRFESFSYRTDQPFDRTKLTKFIDTLPNSVWRLKGIVHIHDSPKRPQLLQRVGPRWDMTAAPASAASSSTLVIIGVRGDFQPESIRASLDEALAT